MKTVPLILFAALLAVPASAEFPSVRAFLADNNEATEALGGRSAEALRLPGIFDLIDYLPDNPAYTRKPEDQPGTVIKTWRLASSKSYRSEREAKAVMLYWVNLLEKNNVSVSTYNLRAVIAELIEFEILYTGEAYLARYVSPGGYPSEAAARAAMTAANTRLENAGLKVMAGIPAISGGQFTYVTYYLVAHAGEKNARTRTNEYGPLVLYPGSDAARDKADKIAAAFERYGFPVLDIDILSGPRGSLYKVHYLGREDNLQQGEAGPFDNEAAAREKLAAFTAGLKDAVVLDSEVFQTGPWFEDLYSFRIRYLADPPEPEEEDPEV